MSCIVWRIAAKEHLPMWTPEKNELPCRRERWLQVLSASPPSVLKIFISYSRRDLQIANSFVDELKAKNFEVFIDKRGLQYGEQWQNQLAESIRSSDTVVWLISEASVASRWVKWELGEVERLKKRLVPVRIANVDPDALPESLGKIHALPSDEVFDFSRHFLSLVDALKTDAAWLREATRLLDRAGQWKAKDQDEAQLLGGRALSDAEGWVSTKPAAAPAINSEILDLLLHSRQGVSRRQKRTVLLSLLVAALGIGLAVYAWLERNSALASQSTYLSKLSAENVTNGDAVTGALLAMSALPTWPYALDRPLVPEAERSLHDAMFSMREMRVLEGHTADVNTAVFSADDKLILTASDDGTARLWRADSGEFVRTIGKHSGKVLSAIFVASNKLILTAVDESATVWLWNASDGSLHHPLTGHSDPIKSVAATPGGDRIVSASSDWTARVWRPNSPGEPPIVLRGHNGPVNTAIFSPDERQVLTSSEDGSAILWKLETGQAERQLSGHHDSVLRAVFNQAGSQIATISDDRTARVWETLTGEQIAKLEHPRPISSVEFCPSGDCIVTTGYDGVARVWDIKTGDIKHSLNGHSEQIKKVAVDPAGRNSAVTVGRDGAIFVWDIETGTKVLTLNVHAADIFDASFSSTGEFLVTTSRDQTARVWRVPAAATTLGRTNIGADTRTIDVDGKAKLAVLGSYDGTVALVDISASKRLASATISKTAVTLARFNEQASQVLLGSEDGGVALYSIPNLERLYIGMTDNSEIAGGYFTNAGFSVLTTGGSTYGYDGTTLSQVRHHNYDSAFTIVPAGDDRALVGGAKGATRIIDASGKKIVELEGHGGTVLHAAFGPGGGIVATVSEDGTGIIWNAVTGDKLNILTGHQLLPSFVALSEDGRYAAIASQDGTVRIWKMEASTPSAVYRGHLAAVRAVRFLPSGGMVSVSKDGEVHYWHFGDDYSRAAATTKAMLPRCFTSKQLAAFGLRKEPPDLCRSKSQTENRNE